LTLCVVISPGDLGVSVARYVKNYDSDVKTIGIGSTRVWLKNLLPETTFVDNCDIKECTNLIQGLGVTEVVFAGYPIDSFDMIGGKKQRLEITEGKNIPSLWDPNTHVKGMKNELERKKISIRNLVNYFPGLAPESGFCLQAEIDYNPTRDFLAASQFLDEQQPDNSTQSCIVDDGKVLLPKNRSTPEYLVKDFGKSDEAKSATFPALCMKAVPPFAGIFAPVVGIETVRLCKENNIRAILIEANNSILIQLNEIQTELTDHSLGIYAVDI